MKPNISVVLPFYNAATTIAATLESILSQTETNFEIIAVDDGSSDNSATIVAQYAALDNRICLLRRAHQGVVATSNYAHQQCRSDLVARMDADDLMHPQRLALQYQFLIKNPKIALVGSKVSLFPAEAIGGGSKEYIRWQNSCITPDEIANNMYVELPIANPSIMLRNRIFHKIGGYRQGMFPEDYELLLRMQQHGYAMAKLPQTLVSWRESPNRLTHRDCRYSLAAFSDIRSQYLSQDSRLQQQRPIAVWGAGRKTRKRFAYLQRFGFVPKVWIDVSIKRIGNRIDGAMVEAPQWLHQQSTKPFVLCYVNNHGIRDEIAAWLQQHNYQCSSDFLMVG